LKRFSTCLTSKFGEEWSKNDLFVVQRITEVETESLKFAIFSENRRRFVRETALWKAS